MRDQVRDDMKCSDAPIEEVIKDKGLPAGSRAALTTPLGTRWAGLGAL